MKPTKQFEALRSLSILPDQDRQAWLRSAEEGIDFLRNDVGSDFVVLHASMPFVWIVSAFAPNPNLYPVDHDDLQNARIDLDDTWVIQKSYGSGEGHCVYLDPPLSFDSKSLAGGELPIFRRTFHGMDRREPLEVNQKLIHCLGVFFVDHRSAYCRLDDNGDLEDVICIQSEEGTGGFDRREMVSIREKDLAQYLALSDATLVRKFDFTRVDNATFSHWGEVERATKGDDQLHYSLGLGSGNGSWAHGYQLVPSSTSVEELVAAFEAESGGRATKQYETFIAVDWKNGRVLETSCSPDATANYFTRSDKPFDVSPAFFRSEVLARYKNDPDKYRLDDRSISCRNAWYLKTYDINEDGQVHTYLCYLANLPIAEQRYWKAFNEPPKGSATLRPLEPPRSLISQRAFETDFEGNWSSEYDPLAELKRKIESLNKRVPPWWTKRSDQLLETARYPTTESTKEWADELLALDKVVVEGFIETKLKQVIDVAGGTKPIQGGSLNALMAALEARGLRAEEAASVVAPLRTLHHLRSKVTGHSSSDREALAKKALMEHMTYRAHFSALAGACDVSLDRIMAALGVKTADDE